MLKNCSAWHTSDTWKVNYVCLVFANFDLFVCLFFFQKKKKSGKKSGKKGKKKKKEKDLTSDRLVKPLNSHCVSINQSINQFIKDVVYFLLGEFGVWSRVTLSLISLP